MNYNLTKETRNMSKRMVNNLRGRARVWTAVCLALLLGAFYPGAVSNVNAQTEKKEAASSEGGGRKEGIKVHGHWTIEVRNPDGKVVTRQEFENALDPTTGSPALSRILGRQGTAGDMEIILGGHGPQSGGTGPCQQWSGFSFVGYVPCEIVEANSPSFGFKTLTLSLPPVGAIVNTNALILSGTATFSDNTLGNPGGGGTITAVSTAMVTCAPTVALGSCHAGQGNNYLRLTTAVLATPVDVKPGQIVQVTVALSFS
ncbi:MAG: hypothetical protein LC746_08575 [Acidobacteria bacterium]|nr:hypothetical protein [Acidobacteriota bacterium]